MAEAVEVCAGEAVGRYGSVSSVQSLGLRASGVGFGCVGEAVGRCVWGEGFWGVGFRCGGGGSGSANMSQAREAEAEASAFQERCGRRWRERRRWERGRGQKWQEMLFVADV